MSLCYRCEHRAQYLENGKQPRFECGVVDTSKFACYMYLPTKPVVISPLDMNDPRPRFAGILATREKFERVPDDEISLSAIQLDGHEVILLWEYNN